MMNAGFRSIFVLAIVILVSIYLHTATIPRMNTKSLQVATDTEPSKTLRVALLSDLHIQWSPAAVTMLSELWSGVIEQTPDVILLAGDYINDGSSKYKAVL
mgnify:FL=1